MYGYGGVSGLSQSFTVGRITPGFNDTDNSHNTDRKRLASQCCRRNWEWQIVQFVAVSITLKSAADNTQLESFV